MAGDDRAVSVAHFKIDQPISLTATVRQNHTWYRSDLWGRRNLGRRFKADPSQLAAAQVLEKQLGSAQ